ncbi:MAG: hypothetical protein GWO02_06050 [Gammaproteobacteria bacterium]|nr:hypothetical protein [Gammaproteobacteria bacterium]
MDLLIESRRRRVYHVAGGVQAPASYLVVDPNIGGILVNAPAFSAGLLAKLQERAALRYIFLPSHLGARDLDAWRAATGAEALAHGAERGLISGTIDVALAAGSKLSRTIDFLALPGRTPGTCAMRLRHRPAVVLFGPALSPGPSGWPTLVPAADDHSWENRVIGALGLRGLRYDYALTDRFEPGRTRLGPGADRAVASELAAALA